MNTVNGKLNIWAAMLGANETMQSLSFPYGFQLSKHALSECPYSQQFVDGNAKLRPEYLASNIGEDKDPTYMFLRKEIDIPTPVDAFSVGALGGDGSDIDNLISDDCASSIEQIADIVSLLRIAKEGNIEVYSTWFQFYAQYQITSESIKNIREKSHLSIAAEAVPVYNNCYFPLATDVAAMQTQLDHSIQVISMFQNHLRRFDKCYCVGTLWDAFGELVTLCEMLLIGHNAKDKNANGIKKRFSNRLAAMLSSDDDVQNVYDRAFCLYKFRSEDTHQGNAESITEAELIELREYTRLLLCKYLDFAEAEYARDSSMSYQKIKKQYILKCIERVKQLQQSGKLL